jgi:hypothetical protein
MDKRIDPWRLQPWLLVEVFAILNLGFLTFDIYLAHSTNDFRRPAEYIPLYFSASAPVLLLIGLALRRRWVPVWKDLGYLAGWAAIAVGLAGVIFHLDSAFFYERTIHSLTYSAPFAAPLAYAGLGFLLVLNRMLDSNTVEWARWVWFMTLGGFVGSFIFCLTDHAGNGFFYPVEWVAVVASAIAVGFLVTPLVTCVSRKFLLLCGVVLALEAVVGVWGFVLHAERNLRGPSVHPLSNFVYGAPPMAPLLFPNLVVLGLIALWQVWKFAPEANRAL